MKRTATITLTTEGDDDNSLDIKAVFDPPFEGAQIREVKGEMPTLVEQAVCIALQAISDEMGKPGSKPAIRVKSKKGQS